MNRILFAFLLLTVAGCAYITPRRITQTADAPVVAPDSGQFDITALQFPQLRDVALLAVEEVELPNGLKLYLTEDHALPMVSISARIGGGAVWEPAEKAGLAGIVGTVMRTGGTTSMTPDELNLALENVGATIETSIGDDSGFAFMNTLTESLDTVLPLFAAVLMSPAFDADQVELAKTRANSGISRRNDNPQGIATRELFKLVFGADSPYARDTEYWTIDAISREDLQAFHAEYFHPNNTSMAVWGDFDASEMADRIREAFGGWEQEAGFQRPEPPPVNTSRESTLHFIQKDDVTQSTVLIGHPGEIRLDDPDYFAVVVMNEILGGGFSSRLFQTVRTDLGLAYAVWGNYSADYETPGVFYAGTFTKSESTTDAVHAMREVIASMRTTAPSEEELYQAREAYLNSFVFNFDTKQEVLNRQMTYAYYGYPTDFVQQIKAGVEAVTVEDVQRVAQRYLHPDEAHILILGNAEDFSEPLSALGAVEEIDIEIPLTQPGVPTAAPSDDADAGASLLDAVTEALGGADTFGGFEAVHYVAESRTGTPEEGMTAEVQATIAFPDRVRAVQRTPMGEMTVILNGSAGKILTPMGEQVAPPELVAQLRARLLFELPYLLASASELVVSELPDEDGFGVLAFEAPGQSGQFKMFVDLETGFPDHIQGTVVGRQGPSEVVVRFGDYRETDGVMLPYLSTQFTAGEESGRSVYSAIEINPAIDDALFDIGD